jgi:hypothetical protein
MSAFLSSPFKILCYVNHFYGTSASFEGKSSTQQSTKRKEIAEECIAQLKQLGQVDVKVCGIEGHSLVDIDINFPELKDNPTLLVYESLNHMAQYINEYDYFINLEDDILLPVETFENIIEFDQNALVNEILHPNRVEIDDNGYRYCVDFYAGNIWTIQKKNFKKREFKVHINPHSGILIMRRDKFKYAIDNIDTGFRGIIIAKAMESAFAHFHSCFALYRSYDDLNFHYIFHLDRWMQSPRIFNRENPYQFPHIYKRKKMTFNDFIPPVILMAYRSLKRM